jgi:hypothetical protein
MIQSLPSKLLASAARDILKPIGLRQKGRSRTWLDDQGWWLVVVEFQPSGWAKGTYLNVGACWLWSPRDYIAFDEGYRVETFNRFHTAEQFTQHSRRLAKRAADEVSRYRARFDSIKTVSDYYDKKAPEDIWGLFHASVAAGLSGRTVKAKKYLARLARQSVQSDWQGQPAQSARNLEPFLEKTDRFRIQIGEMVTESRATLGLPEWRDPYFQNPAA